MLYFKGNACGGSEKSTSKAAVTEGVSDRGRPEKGKQQLQARQFLGQSQIVQTTSRRTRVPHASLWGQPGHTLLCVTDVAAFGTKNKL